MIREIAQILSGWYWLDSWTVVTAALASMSCCVPGVFLLVRRQSMMGDALSHTTLPGIALGFLAAMWARDLGWMSDETYSAWRHGVVVIGAAAVGVISAMLTQALQKIGGVEPNAALGVVFTSLFALGLLLIRLCADEVDLDANCVLYGAIETAAWDRVDLFGWDVPRAAVLNGGALLGNLILVALFFKELRIAAFDPALATSMGINAQVIHYVLMSITAMTLVAAFESVGSILVIAMLVTPAATAHLLVDRLGKMMVVALVVAASSAALGHVMAITLPSILFRQLGFDIPVDASTAGMMAVAAGAIFTSAALLGPRYGIISRALLRLQLSIQVAAQDILGALYRRDEKIESPDIARTLQSRTILQRLARRWLLFKREIVATGAGVALTDLGRQHAERLVRSHRLWESYMAKHLVLPEDHLHATAERVEHYIDGSMRAEIAAELAAPGQDPHGRVIPGE
jgi:manganese/zinc/iron transport system permease protein